MRPHSFLLAGLFVLAAVLCFAAIPFLTGEALQLATWSGFGLAFGAALNMGDALLKVTKALPIGASSITTDGIDLGVSSRGDFVATCELLITAPALAVGQLADASTMKYTIEHDTDAAFGTVATLQADVIVQTGAGGVGAAGVTKRVRLPVDVNRYVRMKVTNSAAANASAASVTAELKF